MHGAEASGVLSRLKTRTVVVVPCYNESGRFSAQTFIDFSVAHRDIGFLLVDDGSTDRTRGLLESLQKSDPSSFSVLSLERNAGKGEAVRQGLLRAFLFEPAFVGYWDADLATPLNELPEFISILSEDSSVFLVMGSRVQRLGSRISRSLWRHCIGRIFASLASSALRLSVYDTQCGAKLMRVDQVLRDSLLVPFNGRWIFDVELIQRLLQKRRHCSFSRLAISNDLGIVEVPLVRWVDVPGSKVRATDGLNAFLGLVRLWIKTRIYRN